MRPLPPHLLCTSFHRIVIKDIYTSIPSKASSSTSALGPHCSVCHTPEHHPANCSSATSMFTLSTESFSPTYKNVISPLKKTFLEPLGPLATALIYIFIFSLPAHPRLSLSLTHTSTAKLSDLFLERAR